LFVTTMLRRWLNPRWVLEMGHREGCEAVQGQGRGGAVRRQGAFWGVGGEWGSVVPQRRRRCGRWREPPCGSCARGRPPHL
jgi:hypothetical protein